jgi:pilus assembly protein CpaB
VTRRRRASLLLGLAIVLGALAAANVSRREAAIRAQLGPLTELVVARRDLEAGHVLALADLGSRVVPARYAPPGSTVFAASLAGRRLAVPVQAGEPLSEALLAQRPVSPAAAVPRGQRAIDVVATGSAQAVVAGARVDVVVTTERRDTAPGITRLALQNVAVLAAHALPPSDEARQPRVLATLRVPATDAVYLAAAQSFAADIRLLARAPGDDARLHALTVDDGL